MLVNSTVHILNGDALADRFPSALEGEVMVARACLVDGPVWAANLPELFETRSHFLHEAYGIPKEDYLTRSVPEFEKICRLEPQQIIHLWFEDDLFCQVNLWFVCHLIREYSQASRMYLVRPPKFTPWGFAALDEGDLVQAQANRQALGTKEIAWLAELWRAYQNGDRAELQDISEKALPYLPFLAAAVEAELRRDDPKRGPKAILKQLMVQSPTGRFGPVFRDFCQQEGIYGFGDLQVKRMFDELKGQALDSMAP